MIDAKTVAELRAKTGAGIVDCKKALEETGGDLEAAMEVLRKKGIAKAGKKADRETGEGLVHAYIHSNGKVGVMVEVLCETDFVARNDAFKELCNDIALQIAAMSPLYISREDAPEEVVAKEKEMIAEELTGSGKPPEMIEKIVEGKIGKWYEEVCLFDQPFVKDEDVTIGEMVKAQIGKIGENIQVKRFARFAIGS